MRTKGDSNIMGHLDSFLCPDPRRNPRHATIISAVRALRQCLSLAANVAASSEQSLSSVCRFGRESDSPAVDSVQFLIHTFRICVPAVLLLLPLPYSRMKRNTATRKGFFLSDLSNHPLLSQIVREFSHGSRIYNSPG